MSKDHSEGYARKHPGSSGPDETVASVLKEKCKDGRISCAAAHGVAGTLAKTPAEIGIALDLVEIRLTKCQMGLFGYTPDKRIVKKAEQWPSSLEKDIQASLVEGRLACADAWRIAKQHDLTRPAVANVCEALGIKIKPCQLGAF